MQGIMQIPYQPVLPYNKNNLGISCKGISFSYASGLEYSYKLEGADTNWSAATTSDFVSFVGLPPGKYSFKVRARKSNSEWSQPDIFSFIIQKPFLGNLVVPAIGCCHLLYDAGYHFPRPYPAGKKKAFMQNQVRELR